MARCGSKRRRLNSPSTTLSPRGSKTAFASRGGAWAPATRPRRGGQPACRRSWRSGAPSPCVSSRRCCGGGDESRAARRRRDDLSTRSSRRRRRCAAANISTPTRLAALWRSLSASVRRRTRRERPRRRRVPRRARQPLAARRARAFQPRREPQGRRAAVRVSGDLCPGARRARRAAPRAARRGVARICGRRGQGRTACKLLEPVSRASEACGWLKEIVDTGEIFHPLRWTAAEAMRLLGDVDALEQAGLVVRMPASLAGEPAEPPVGRGDRRRRSALARRRRQLLDFTSR